MVTSIKLLLIRILFCYVITSDSRSWRNVEQFSTTTNVSPLLQTQKNIKEDLDHYIQNEMKRIEILTQHLNHFEVEHNKTVENIKNITQYSGNSIVYFIAIKRLTMSIDFIEKTFKNKTNYKKSKKLQYPSKGSLFRAAQTLHRVQFFYNLNITELAKGVLMGNFSNSHKPYKEHFVPMSASDCYQLGRILCNATKYESGIFWLLEALLKLCKTERAEISDISLMEVVEDIANAFYSLGNIKSAFEWRQEKDSTEVWNNRISLKDHSALRCALKAERYRSRLHKEEVWKSDSMMKIYAIACRAATNVPCEIKKRLQCRYLTDSHPFLTLARVKVEQLYLEPDVLLFHDVISDKEIEYIKNIAKSKMQRVQIRNNETNKIFLSKDLISTSTTIRDEESEVVARISRRVSDVTGLSITFSQALQVANYDVGGHFKPHYDFIKDSESQRSRCGNIISTVLFYMWYKVVFKPSQVFPDLRLTVFPEKGAALFWTNLHQSGKGDEATIHASCPVLRGSKWVSNKWLHEQGQEFLRPCDLQYQERKNSLLSPETYLSRTVLFQSYIINKNVPYPVNENCT